MSTGPKTEAGKKRPSLNALCHGLTSHIIVLPSEDLAAYQKFSQGFVNDLQPKGTLEQQLVQILADTSWAINRASAMENNLLSLGFQKQADRSTPTIPKSMPLLPWRYRCRRRPRLWPTSACTGMIPVAPV